LYTENARKKQGFSDFDRVMKLLLEAIS